MLHKAYEAQCAAVKVHSTKESEQRSRGLTLFALALGSFCIGTSEFASMGILQLFSASLGIDIPTATNAIAAYAFGVVIGAPLVTLVAARLNRRTLLLCLAGLLILGNVLSAIATDLGMFALARFISGMPQGAYFGAGAVVASYIVGPGHGGKAFALVMTGLIVATIIGSPLATFLGQNLGWRNTYITVAGVAALAYVALWIWVPRTEALHGGPLVQELSSLRKPAVWDMMLVAALGVASIFAVYTFIGPFVTDVAKLNKVDSGRARAVRPRHGDRQPDRWKARRCASCAWIDRGLRRRADCACVAHCWRRKRGDPDADAILRRHDDDGRHSYNPGTPHALRSAAYEEWQRLTLLYREREPTK